MKRIDINIRIISIKIKSYKSRILPRQIKLNSMECMNTKR
jgi:hypothetical protein